MSSFFGRSGLFMAGKLANIWTTKDNFLVLFYCSDKMVFLICGILVNK